ncbi:hypothetical protein CHH28_16680 [Bacterioplanes sanyensis]|uniref:Uncharacterized protein n=1 Tax=Bacterioplanes sanyensis TaxID=1249553 RepID=A0A222FN45_9GAMM|nr:hypothetical protein [Bacterioplanes sanyensis]ASP40210.1 hypothetical protein CHH28_16680 [Bacterioplanes sanyensis]
MSAWGKGNGYQPTLDQMQGMQFGKTAVDKSLSGGSLDNKKLKDSWRMGQEDHGYGGHGKDETMRTSAATALLVDMGKAGVPEDQVVEAAKQLSMDRTDTAALVWYNQVDHMGKAVEMGGHPGSLRNPSQMTAGRGTHNKGHNSRDSARIRAAQTEFTALDPKSTGYDPKATRAAIGMMGVRAQLETIRTMSTPLEEFGARGVSGEQLTHARHGPLSDAGNFGRMAAFVHDSRETMKWDAARRLMTRGLHDHVPQEMQDYLNHSKGDHHQALAMYQHQLFQGAETRVNTATTSQADNLGADETLQHAASEMQQKSRARALSIPRKMVNPPRLLTNDQ